MKKYFLDKKEKTHISDINEKVKCLLYFLGLLGVYFLKHFSKVYVSYFNYRCLSYMSKHEQCLSQHHIYWNYKNCGLKSEFFSSSFNLQIISWNVFHIYIYFDFFHKTTWYHLLKNIILSYIETISIALFSTIKILLFLIESKTNTHFLPDFLFNLWLLKAIKSLQIDV